MIRWKATGAHLLRNYVFQNKLFDGSGENRNFQKYTSNGLENEE